jgi:hypothetical protein
MKRPIAIVMAALLATIAATGEAHATLIPLGSFSAPATIPVGDSGLGGSFDDSFTFSIDAGTSAIFSAFLSTGFSNRAFILDMEASLSSGGQPVEPGNATTVFLPEGFPSRNVSFDQILLGSGDYTLEVVGTGTSVFPGPTSGYSGTITLDPGPPPIDEPTTVSLLLAALGIAAWLGARQSRA